MTGGGGTRPVGLRYARVEACATLGVTCVVAIADGAPLGVPPNPGADNGAANPQDRPPDPAQGEPSGQRSARRRGLEESIDEVSYLVAQDVRHYRPLMRLFLEAHQAQRYFLDVEDVHAHVRQRHDPAYTAEQCQADLDQLVQWGNLTRHYARTRVHTIDEFLRRQAVYQATPGGIGVERFVAALEEEGRRTGSLDRTILAALWQRMRELDALLGEQGVLVALGDPAGTGAAMVGPAARQTQERVATLWAEVHHHFERVANDGVSYLAQLRGVQAQQILEHSAFHAYKDVLVRYLSDYALALAETGPLIASTARGWSQTSRGAVVAFCAGAVAARQPLPDGSFPNVAVEIAHVHRRADALARWFDPAAGDIVRLKQSTNDAIELVTRQAARLADLRWGSRSRRRDLEELAILFAHCTDVAQAERIAAVAFAAALPRHWQADRVPDNAGRASPWLEPAEEVVLAPIRRGARIRTADDPLPERGAARDALIRDTLGGRAAAARRLRGLFGAAGRCDLGELRLSDPGLRDDVLELLGRCLAATDGAAAAPDGGRIVLSGEAGDFGRIEAPDGTLRAPQWVLTWEPAAYRAGGEERGA